MSQVENFIFQPGDTTKDVHIMINNDGLTEELENFVLRLTSNNSAQITIGTPFTSSVIINDDDGE